MDAISHQFTIEVFPSPVLLAQAVADAWLGRIVAATAAGAVHRVALSGGRIAGQVLAETASRVRARGLSLDRVEFYWSDERCVPPDSAEANYNLAWTRLLQPAGISPRRVHRLQGELQPESGARQAEAELRSGCPSNPAGQPVLDLVFLGMGEDGHIASVFPSTAEAIWQTAAAFSPVIGPKPPPQRLTMTPAVLTAATEVWVLASGAEKQRAWHDSVRPGGRTPLGRLLGLRTATRVWTEQALLSPPPAN